MDDFAEIAKRMKELNLRRDKPFEETLQPDFHAELNAKLKPKYGLQGRKEFVEVPPAPANPEPGWEFPTC